jgi:hypothetical protein
VRPAAAAFAEAAQQVVREAFELGLDAADDAAEHVVGQHGRNGDRQAEGRHDQRLAHRAGHLVDGEAAGLPRDARQRAVDAPHRAQQADEGRGGAHGGQQDLAGLQAPQRTVQRVAQHAGQALVAVDRRHPACPGRIARPRS